MNLITRATLNDHAMRFYDDNSGNEYVYARSHIVGLTYDGTTMHIVADAGIWADFKARPTDIVDEGSEPTSGRPLRALQRPLTDNAVHDLDEVMLAFTMGRNHT
jgi:hypothetical protein